MPSFTWRNIKIDISDQGDDSFVATVQGRGRGASHGPCSFDEAEDWAKAQAREYVSSLSRPWTDAESPLSNRFKVGRFM